MGFVRPAAITIIITIHRAIIMIVMLIIVGKHIVTMMRMMMMPLMMIMIMIMIMIMMMMMVNRNDASKDPYNNDKLNTYNDI